MTPQQTPPSAPRPSSGDGASVPPPPANPRAVTRGLGAVLVRNEYYRDGYRVLQSIAVTQAIIICVMAFAMLFVIHINQKEIRYFATNQDGSLIPMVPMNEPTLSPQAIQAWAASAVSETMTFGFNDYQRRFAASRRYFTDQGYANFTKKLAERGVIEAVYANKQVVSAVSPSTPVIKASGTVEVDGVFLYQWIIQVPTSITYQSIAGGITTQRRIIELRIVRTPQSESPQGIGILQWIELEGGS